MAIPAASGQRIPAAGCPQSHEAVPTGHESLELIQRGSPVGSQRFSYPRVPLVPRSTRGYPALREATTPWFVIEGAVFARCAFDELRNFKYLWL